MSKDKGAKDKKAKKGKRVARRPPAEAITIHNHPRAARSVRRAKGWGGLIAFGLVAFLSHRAGATLEVSLARALVGGILGLLVAWFVAVQVWRALIVGELKAAEKEIAVRREQRIKEAEQRLQAKRAATPTPAPEL